MSINTENSTSRVVMTQEKLLSMSEDDYMNDDQLAFFQNLLQGLRDDVIKEIEEGREQLPSERPDGDEADQAAIVSDLQFGLRTLERKTKLLHKIDLSLKQIEDKTYGYCLETDEPIGLQRLLVRPTATMAIQSKIKQEFEEDMVAKDSSEVTAADDIGEH